MSYETDAMMSLSNSLRSVKGLQLAIEELNENIEVLERLAQAIEEQNELKRQELEIISKERISITRIILLRITAGILELLFASEHFPSFVIHTFVALGTGLPSAI